MCFVYFSRNFISSLCSSSVMIRSKGPKILQISRFNSTRHHSESEFSSFNEFDMSGSLKSYYKVNFQAITQGNPDQIKKLELLLMKMELDMQKKSQLPKTITTDHWKTILTLSEDETLAFFQYRLAVEYLIESKEKEREKVMNYFENNSSRNGLFDSSIVDRIPYLYDFNSIQAMRYGSSIVIDCGSEKIVPRCMIWSTAFQMFQAWLKNRIFCHPSHIIFCNLKPNGEFFPLIMEMFKDTNQDSSLFTWTSKSYLDLFPIENLIYLSPDSRNTMEKYNGKKVYIIGGLSHVLTNPITYKKAKLEEIQTAKLPVDKYVDWGFGPKNLSISNCVNLLNDLKEGSTWNIAFRHLPKQAWARHTMDEDTSRKYKLTKRKPKSSHDQYRQHLLKTELAH